MRTYLLRESVWWSGEYGHMRVAGAVGWCWEGSGCVVSGDEGGGGGVVGGYGVCEEPSLAAGRGGAGRVWGLLIAVTHGRDWLGWQGGGC